MGGGGSKSPKHVPGPSPADLFRANRARVEAEQARAAESDRANELERQLEEIEQTIRKKKEDLENYPVPEYLKSALKSCRLNIAVTGQSGVGKSLFINFMRALKASDEGYAKTGLTECTAEPTLYEFKASESSDCKDHIWDLPGAGTEKWPVETYLARTGIRYFDVVLLLTADRFTEAEVMLKNEMDEKGVPYFCVRTRADVAWDSKVNQEEEDKGEELTDERKQELKNDTITEIKSFFDFSVYLISSLAKYKKVWEFDDLKTALTRAVENARCDQHCPVCFEMYAEHGGTGAKTKVGECEHFVCEECIAMISPSCPICRQPCFSGALVGSSSSTD